MNDTGFKCRVLIPFKCHVSKRILLWSVAEFRKQRGLRWRRWLPRPQRQPGILQKWVHNKHKISSVNISIRHVHSNAETKGFHRTQHACQRSRFSFPFRAIYGIRWRQFGRYRWVVDSYKTIFIHIFNVYATDDNPCRLCRLSVMSLFISIYGWEKKKGKRAGLVPSTFRSSSRAKVPVMYPTSSGFSLNGHKPPLPFQTLRQWQPRNYASQHEYFISIHANDYNHFCQVNQPLCWKWIGQLPYLFSDIMELKRMMEKLGQAKTHLELKKMIAEVDTTNSGSIFHCGLILKRSPCQSDVMWVQH